ncbi:MAG TPA: carbamate kinase [Actinomycetota bacterium]|nr:carbamate kinase [Actinomycetota bacterium]
MVGAVERVVVALGGNALLEKGAEETAEAMWRSARFAAEVVADIAGLGYEVVVTHGNGPQVGRILLQNELAKDAVPPMPLDVCGAESQGQIGYFLQVTVGDVFYERGMERPVVTILTLTRVPRDDPAFADPTKPVGPFYDDAEARRLAGERGWRMAPDPAGRGWRRVVPSPRPYSIVEAPVIRQVVATGAIVICAGGGGVPVVEEGPRLVGVEGVVDKDLAAAILARDVEADTLLILTDVDGVYEDFGTPAQRLLTRLTPEEARRRLEAGEFGVGSMGPKVEAAAQFVEGGGKRAVIAALRDGARAVGGRAGTLIAH